METAATPRGLTLAREKGWLLAWDKASWLYLLNRKGVVQAQRHSPGQLTSACGADDGSSYAAVGSAGEIGWLAPDLTPRWQQKVSHKVLAAAMDPFGQYLAIADQQANLYLFDRTGRRIFRTQTPRPLHHLAFLPEASRFVGSADFGLVACFDLAGHCAWRDGPVAHVGSLAVSGDGHRLVLACFSEGLRSYSLTGKRLEPVAVPEPCRLAALSYDGAFTLAAGLEKRLFLLDRAGHTVDTLLLDKPATAFAFGPLGDHAVVATGDGQVRDFDLRRPGDPLR